MKPSSPRIDLDALRDRLAGQQGRTYWRSLEELAETPEFQTFLHDEFPQHSEAWQQPFNRRQILAVMGSSLAMAGLTGCTRPVEKIVPYVAPPESVIPGKPLYFATAYTQRGVANGILVESHMGRPTKIEGNPDHPSSLGATDAVTQAAILDLYDPDRSQVVTHLGNISSWSAFHAALAEQLTALRARKGAGLFFLSESITSPTLIAQRQAVLKEFPEAKWHYYEPAGRDNVRAGAVEAFGEPVNTFYRFEKADRILSLDSDFLASGPGSLRYTRDYIARRKAAEHGEHGETMPRLYVVETTPSSTGAMADHRLALRASAMESFARDMLGAVVSDTAASGPHAAWIKAVAADLKKHRGASLVLAGDEQPAAVHALAHRANQALAAPVAYTAPLEALPVGRPIQELVEAMKGGSVDLLVILNVNPLHTAPADLPVAEHFSKAKLAVHLGPYEDETGTLCHWHLPESHFLEAWGDTVTYDGLASIVQPLIAPLYRTKSVCELLSAFLGKPSRPGYEIVREYWQNRKLSGEFSEVWRKAVHDGLIDGTALPMKRVSLKPDSRTAPPAAPAALELVFRPDPTIGDGRQANNAWLQELAKPVSKLTWDNAAYLSPATAQRLAVSNEDVIELRVGERRVAAPVWIMPGQADESVVIHLGFGRRRAGRVGTGVGFNAYAIRTSAAPWIAPGVDVRKTGEKLALATTQNHHSMEGRNLARSASLEAFRKDHHVPHKGEHTPPPGLTVYPDHVYDRYGWGMSVDLSACVGCNACVVACQAENNIPVVGKEQVIIGREMQWIRIDRYYEGGLDQPVVHYQPVMCQHCENAPCEVVCPVGATAHSSEGLNDMVYNRCVGTRYCSNNCPYKVRRFNFLQYTDWETPSIRLLNNPDVTVRSRGVMEKCTYCVQRINGAKIEAEKLDRKVRDGDIQTACQQVCPAQAIVFGDVNDPNSKVAKLRKDPLKYGLLEDLNTRPRTTYLARLRNPNPELEGGKA